MLHRPLGLTGLSVPILSFGASPLGGVFRATDDAESLRAVAMALDLGMNFLDTSPFYGATRSESVLGRALRGVPRDRYLLATKVGQYGEGQFDFSAKRVRESLDESCARLGVDYIDLLQCHDIEFVTLDQIVEETLPAMVQLRESGRIGHIGITGLPLKIFPAILDRVAPGTVETVLSFCRYELNDTSLAGLLPYFAARGVGVINASPTGMGLLSHRGPPAWHPAPQAIKDAAGRAAAYCESVGADLTKLAIQFCTRHPAISTTLVGSANPENIRRNVAYLDEPYDEELMQKVLAILAPVHNHNFTRGLPENRDPIIG